MDPISLRPERALSAILVPREALSWRTARRRSLHSTPEGVEEQRDEHQPIAFVLVYAGEERHACLGPRAKASRTAGEGLACRIKCADVVFGIANGLCHILLCPSAHAANPLQSSANWTPHHVLPRAARRWRSCKACRQNGLSGWRSLHRRARNSKPE